MSLIFLTGMPGAGKTYWGNKLKEAYQVDFTDLDEYIENKLHQPITTIFQEYGESYFREQETIALREVIGKHNAIHIIATGGGTAAHNDNMILMKGSGCVVYLQASPQTLYNRLKEHTDRPLLKNKPDLLLNITNLLTERQKIYEQAHYILDVESISIANFGQIISVCTGQR